MSIRTVKKFFQDKNGEWAVIQFPNLLLWLWLSVMLIAVLPLQNNIEAGFHQLGSALLFAWAYLEVTQGSSYFRRVFGGIILCMIVLNFFNIHL